MNPNIGRDTPTMDVALSEELAVLRESAARFAAEHVEPYAQEWDRASWYPDEMIRKLGEQGFMGIMVPESLGGGGGNHQAFGVILEELARHDGGLALAVEAHNGLCCAHILLAGTEEQKQRFLPPLATGEEIGSWCLTEPGSGTDAAAMTSRAQRHGEACQKRTKPEEEAIRRHSQYASAYASRRGSAAAVSVPVSGS